MGFSVTLSHIIMVIASVCLASAFSAYAFYTGNVVQNELMQNVLRTLKTGFFTMFFGVFEAFSIFVFSFER